MAQAWSKYCNTNAYGLDTAGGDNLQTIEYKSGRVVRYLKNSKTKKEHSIKFKFDDSRNDPSKIIDGKTEYQHFIEWLDVTLRGCVDTFLFIDLIGRKNMKEYYFRDYPTITGQKWKYVSCTFVEA